MVNTSLLWIYTVPWNRLRHGIRGIFRWEWKTWPIFTPKKLKPKQALQHSPEMISLA